jgi:hypothetical protein
LTIIRQQKDLQALVRVRSRLIFKNSRQKLINNIHSLQELIVFSGQYLAMEIIEIIGWIALGFVPMLGGLEIASRKLHDRGKMVLRTYIKDGVYKHGL